MHSANCRRWSVLGRVELVLFIRETHETETNFFLREADKGFRDFAVDIILAPLLVLLSRSLFFKTASMSYKQNPQFKSSRTNMAWYMQIYTQNLLRFLARRPEIAFFSLTVFQFLLDQFEDPG